MTCGSFATVVIAVAYAATAQAQVKAFTVHELAWQATNPGANPYIDGPALVATFTHASGKTFRVPGFWDGGATWRVRFTPTTEGTWTWTTTSSDPGLNGKSGQLTAEAATAEEKRARPLLRGFIQPRGHAWVHGDGTPFLPVGDTQWSFTEELTTDEWMQWVKVLERRGYNSFLGCVWLGIYDRAKVSPFRNRDPRTDDLQVTFFQTLDRWVAEANARGIVMGLTVAGFPGNSRWWTRFGTQAREDRWFRYVVARYAAYNVRWLAYGEGDEGRPSWGTGAAEVERKARLIREVDPYDHPVSSHAQSIGPTGDAFDHIVVQVHGLAGNATGAAPSVSNAHRIALDLRSRNKPIHFDDYWYEAYRAADPTKDLSAGAALTHRAFVAALAFPTMGSLMRNHADAPLFPPGKAAAAGVSLEAWLLANDPGMRVMQGFRALYGGLDTTAFAPAPTFADRGVAGRFGAAYAVFVEGGGSVTVDLTSTAASLEVRALDILTGEVRALPPVVGGAKRTVQTGSSKDTALVFSPVPPSSGPGADAATLASTDAGADASGGAHDAKVSAPDAAMARSSPKFDGPSPGEPAVPQTAPRSGCALAGPGAPGSVGLLLACGLGLALGAARFRARRDQRRRKAIAYTNITRRASRSQSHGRTSCGASTNGATASSS